MLGHSPRDKPMDNSVDKPVDNFSRLLSIVDTEGVYPVDKPVDNSVDNSVDKMSKTFLYIHLLKVLDASKR